MSRFKKPLLFALSLLPIAVISGVLITLYQMDIYSDEIIGEIAAELGSIKLLIVVGAVQTAGYALFCGFFGYILADKLGLWKAVRVEKKSLLVTVTVSVLGGMVFSLDHWVFGSVIEGIQPANIASLTVSGIAASVLYGGIIEELMLRLFFMSLIAFAVWKLFFKKHEKQNIPEKVFVIANITAAVIFAAGHLPATVLIFGELNPLIIFRCFLLNGGFGLVFGYLYRKYGIAYSMMSHALFHIVSKTVWLIFI